MEISQCDFTYDIVFKHVMKDKGIARDLIECILGKKVQGEIYLTVQKEIDPGPGFRAIRCDAYCTDDGSTIYNIEMQRTDRNPLVTRLRGYQATIDTNTMQEGCDFDDLGEVYVIFICTFDYFKQGKGMYQLEMREVTEPEKPVDSRFHWVILNATSPENAHSAELAALLNYVASGEVGDSDLVKRIAKKVKAVKKRKKVRNMITMQKKHELDLRNTAKTVEDRAVELSSRLVELERYEDILRMQNDLAFREQLFEELGL